MKEKESKATAVKNEFSALPSLKIVRQTGSGDFVTKSLELECSSFNPADNLPQMKELIRLAEALK